jgi:transglutaminase-like putative cysteine protease
MHVIKLWSAALSLFMLLTFLPLGEAARPSHTSGYYESYTIEYEIEADKSLNVSETLVYVNSSLGGIKVTITKRIPNTQLENMSVRDSSGDLSFQTSVQDNHTVVIFETALIPGGQHYTYYVSYAALGAVQGTGPEYRASLGGFSAGEAYDNYTVIVRGPPGTYPFLSDPQADATYDPPTFTYSTSLQAGDSFGGLAVRFYTQPAFYMLRLEYSFANQGLSSTTGLTLDTILFNSDIPWQTSALFSSSTPVKTMYVDNENNWHGVFDVGNIQPGETETLWADLIYEISVYDPRIESGDVGGISDVPSSLDGYLKPDDKWDSNDTAVQQAASLALQGETNVYLAAEKISQYVVALLDYSVQGDRQGSLWALTNRQGDCSEYTDLSIAMARAAGIPARAVYGWGYYENENLRGHAWLEFYFPGEGWQPADPTWRETSGDYFSKLDPIHLTRTIRGLTSSESGANIVYYGQQPQFSEEENIQTTNSSDATQLYISAALQGATLAENLLAENENATLMVKLQQAQSELSLAQSSTDDNQKILHAKNSIENSAAVIMVLGKPPSTPQIFDLELIFYAMIAVVVVATVAGVAYALWRRTHPIRRTSRRSH